MSDDQAFIKQQNAIKKRRFLIAALVVVAIARIVIRNPEKQKAADHSKDFKALPGILKTMTAEEKSRLSPEKIAAFEAADREYLARTTKPAEPTAVAAYIPAPAPVDVTRELKEQATKFEYEYVRRIPKHPTFQDEEPVDTTKGTLVVFATGGYVKAQSAQRVDARVRILVDRTMQAHVPNYLVSSIAQNAVGWIPPVPPGQTKIKPAKGITIIVSSRTAKRISVHRGANET